MLAKLCTVNDKNEIHLMKKSASRKRVHFALSFKYLSIISQNSHMQYLLISDISMEAYKRYCSYA